MSCALQDVVSTGYVAVEKLPHPGLMPELTEPVPPLLPVPPELEELEELPPP